jgi:hypothetical protein
MERDRGRGGVVDMRLKQVASIKNLVPFPPNWMVDGCEL